MATLGLGNTMFALRRQLFAAPCRIATPGLVDATRPRLLSTSAARFRAAAKSNPKTIRPNAPRPTPAPNANPHGTPTPTRYAFIKSLGSKTTPTILYESSSHFWFYFGCWSSGISILGWTVLTGPTVVNQPEGVPAFVGYVFMVAYAMLGAMAFYILTKTPNIVRSIRLLPPAASAARATGPGAVSQAAKPIAAASAPGAAPAMTAMPQLEVTVNRMVPVFPPRVFVVSLDNVALKSRFSLPTEYVPELQRLEQERAADAARAKQRKYDMQHLMTVPFRHAANAVKGFFRGVRSAWTDMGFATIKVNDKEFKVDVTKGFAHEGFKTLERLVSIGYK